VVRTTFVGREHRTLYAILVRGLDLRQDDLSGKGPEDGQPKDDYDIGSKGERKAMLMARIVVTHLCTKESRPHT
jgi:hypothetical protein